MSTSLGVSLPKASTGVLAGGALLLVLLAWGPGAAAPYQYDDFNTPVNDPASQSIAHWVDALARTLRPLTKFTYALESSLGAQDAPSRRWLNGLLFASAAGMLAALARASGLSRTLSLLLACAWAVHPVHAETLLALAGRSVLLSLCFMLGSALLLLRGRAKLALACAALALLARETALPWLIVCTAMAARQHGWSRARVVGLIALSGVVGAWLVLRSETLRALLTFSFGGASALNRLGLQWAALAEGTRLLLFDPSAFTLDMDFAPLGAVRLVSILCAFALMLAAAWLALGAERPLALRILALLWLCLVLPTQSVVPKLDALTARTFSASLAPLGVLIALGCSALTRTLNVRVAPVLLVAAIATLLPATRERAALYCDEVALWRDAAQRSSQHARPWVNLGSLLAQRGQLIEARAALQQALQRDPTNHDTRVRLHTVERMSQPSLSWLPHP